LFPIFSTWWISVFIVRCAFSCLRGFPFCALNQVDSRCPNLLLERIKSKSLRGLLLRPPSPPPFSILFLGPRVYFEFPSGRPSENFSPPTTLPPPPFLLLPQRLRCPLFSCLCLSPCSVRLGMGFFALFLCGVCALRLFYFSSKIVLHHGSLAIRSFSPGFGLQVSFRPFVCFGTETNNTVPALKTGTPIPLGLIPFFFSFYYYLCMRFLISSVQTSPTASRCERRFSRDRCFL